MFFSSPKPWIEDKVEHNQIKVKLCKELKIDLEQSLDVTLPAVMAKVAEEQPEYMEMNLQNSFGVWESSKDTKQLMCYQRGFR